MLWFHPYSLFTFYPSSFWTCGSNTVLDAILSPADIADPFPSPTLDYCLFHLFHFLPCGSILPSPTETLPRHAESPCVSMGLWVLKGYGLRHSMLLHQRHFVKRSRAKALCCAQVLVQAFKTWKDLRSFSILQTAAPMSVLITWNKRHGQDCKALTVSSIISQLLFLDSLMFRPIWKHSLH